MEKPPQEQPEEKIVDGVKYRKVNSGYTVREYFNHPGPGWDTKQRALDEYGVTSAKDLPDAPYFRWEEVEEE